MLATQAIFVIPDSLYLEAEYALTWPQLTDQCSRRYASAARYWPGSTVVCVVLSKTTYETWNMESEQHDQLCGQFVGFTSKVVVERSISTEGSICNAD